MSPFFAAPRLLLMTGLLIFAIAAAFAIPELRLQKEMADRWLAEAPGAGDPLANGGTSTIAVLVPPKPMPPAGLALAPEAPGSSASEPPRVEAPPYVARVSNEVPAPAAQNQTRPMGKVDAEIPQPDIGLTAQDRPSALPITGGSMDRPAPVAAGRAPLGPTQTPPTAPAKDTALAAASSASATVDIDDSKREVARQLAVTAPPFERPAQPKEPEKPVVAAPTRPPVEAPVRAKLSTLAFDQTGSERRVRVERANLRAAPGLQAPVVAVLRRNMTVVLIWEDPNGWAFVDVAGQRGFVKGGLLIAR